MALTINSTGSCLCGGVRYVVHGPLRPIIYCHCDQCRKTSGHYVAAAACDKSDLELINAESLRWYDSSEKAKRAFCSDCGGNLFWQPVGRDEISIMAGTIDLPTGIVASEHIYVGTAADYHQICDGLPQYEKGHFEDVADES